MPVTIDQAASITRVLLPGLEHTSRTATALLRHIAVAARTETVTPRVTSGRNGLVERLELKLSPEATVLVTTGRRKVPPDAELHIHSEDLQEGEGVLIFSAKAVWLKHPALATRDMQRVARSVRESWKTHLNLEPEVRSEDGEVVRAGLRLPQVGALHALAAHWTVQSTTPALVVLPTGTGKTEVMLASLLLRRPERLLVLVPSDALRIQAAIKFQQLGVLYSAAVVGKDCQRPVVAILRKTPKSAVDVANLRAANVVVSTVAMLQNLSDSSLVELLGIFDTVFFDEAHHVPASSWKRLHDNLTGRCVVGFTATPFRQDGERIPGRIVYQFPLRMAQEQGYFKPIDFIAVDEVDSYEADLQIATKAIEQLRRDRANSLQHILLARAATKQRASSLYKEIYSRIAPDLSPALIYSGINNQNKVAGAIREGAHQIVVCVDMFGEGFDLPALKIAAMHDIHQEPVQFSV